MNFNCYTKNWIFYLLICFFLTSATQIQAQTLNKDYWDGQVFFKIHNKSQVTLSDYNHLYTNVNQPAWMQELINTYDITLVTRPFTKLRTPVFERTYKIYFNNATDVQQLIRDLEAIDIIEYAERVPYERTTLVPDDTYANDDIQWFLSTVQAYDAWDLSTGSSDVVIAVVDDAVKLDHEDLADNIWENIDEIPGDGIDNDDNGYVDDIVGWDGANDDNNPNPPSNASNFYFSHGTHCAGTAGAVTDNGRGVAAISYNVKIMACKGANDTNASLSGIWEAFIYAMNNFPQVISCSWGGGGASQTFQNIIDEAYDRDIVVIAAAGNDNSSSIFYPAGYDHVISVASTREGDFKSGFSNYGSWIDIASPGSQIASSVATDNSSYQYYDGTSMACPNVASLVGLMLSYNPGLTPDDVEACLYAGADNINAQNPSFVGQLGAGRINALNSLQCVSPTGCITPNGFLVTNLSSNGALINWNDMPNALSYNFRYRQLGGGWIPINDLSNSEYNITGLLPCTTYEYQALSNCEDAAQSNFSGIRTFTTSPDGVLTYCNASGDDSSFEWIQEVNINTINNVTGNDGGYEDFLCTNTALQQGQSYPISLTPGFSGQTYNEYWKVYIDYNQDGTFSETTELAYDSDSAVSSTVNGTITIPNAATVGSTVMRVVMKWVATQDPALPEACGSFDYGEVEDYGINILSNNTTPTCDLPSSLQVINVINDQANLSWPAVLGASTYNLRYRIVGTTTWQTASSPSAGTTLSGLTACSSYECEIETICNNGLSSGFGLNINFTTANCPINCDAPTGLTATNVGVTTADVSWSAVPEATSYNVRYRYIGLPNWQTINVSTTSTSLSELTNCLPYEFEVQSVCPDGESDFSAGTFTTDCIDCNIPAGIALCNATPNSAVIVWNETPSALSYDVRVRIVGNTNWLEANITDTDANLNNTAACTDWEFQIRSNCDGVSSAYSESLFFSTTGCDDNYCASSGRNAQSEWIESISLANINNNSGSNCGYADFTDITTDLVIGDTYNATLTPGFANDSFTEYWRIWIDFNQDEDFNDENELVYDAGGTNTGEITGSINIPEGAATGATRMRVGMKFVNSGQYSAIPGACMNYSFGEVEDYTVNIVEFIPATVVKLKAVLQGCYDVESNSMTTNLRAADHLPLAQPFNEAPWFYDGTESVNNLNDMPANTVDWVMIEARSASDLNNIVETKAALLLDNGNIVDVNGETDGVNMFALTDGNSYYFSIRARGHVDITTANTIIVPNTTHYDVSAAEAMAMGGDTQTIRVSPTVWALYAGDFNNTGVISVSDYNIYINQSAAINGYFKGDINKDGSVTVDDFNTYQPNASHIGDALIRYEE